MPSSPRRERLLLELVEDRVFFVAIYGDLRVALGRYGEEDPIT
jgi:hypothetical protein